MASKESEEPRVQIHQILLLIAAMAGSIWLYEGPLKSSRPVAHDIENKIAVTIGEDRVQARLWQDPFEAVETHVKSEDSKNSGRSARGETAHSHSLILVATEVATSTPTPRDIQILIILTDGSPYAENRESRLRQRYAVLAGLERAGYVPTDGEHIRFFRWGDSEACQSTSAGHPHTFPMLVQRSQLTVEIDSQALSNRNDDCNRTSTGYWEQAPVPVEWYQTVNGGNSHVLIFWIKDQDLGDQPLNDLRKIQRAVKRGFFGLHPIVSLKIIGPRFSGTLQAVIAKGKEVTEHTPIEIYSPWSTLPESILTGGDQSTKQRLENEATATFVRTVSTDDQLADTLIDELQRRGVTVSGECTGDNTCDHVAVIAEWDTLYGRTLPLTFSALAIDRSAATDSKQFQKALKELKANPDKSKFIHRYSYLRGLDGELPQSKSNNVSGLSSDDKAPSSPLLQERRQDIERMERPEGRSQLDYVRRLAGRLRATENDFLAECGPWKLNCHGFKAIGVLGSDVYDKMLILQV